MPWSHNRPGTKRVYYTPEYLAAKKRLHAELIAAGSGSCAEVICLMRSRVITPGMKLHVCHDWSGTVILGLGHARCNLSDAGRRARARQTVTAAHM